MRQIGLWNWIHICLIVSLPIVLALINPNWIFNPHINDDYIYLGYQMEMPRYTDWFPATDRYFGERVSWIALTYPIRQLVSPMPANFIIHLGVYYVAIFSVYGIITRLTTSHVALIVAVLMGHYPPFMRAVGWDYVDGFIIACMSLCLFFLTQACFSPHRWRLYVIGAGMTGMLFITSNIFYACYVPVVMLYAVWLNHHQHKHSLIACLLWASMGAIAVYVLEGIYYQSVTGAWLTFSTSLSFSQEKFGDIDFQAINNVNFATLIPTWHILPPMVLLVACIQLFRQRTDYRLYASTALLMGTYAVLLVWEALGHRFLQYIFYSSVVIPMTFMVLGIVIAKYPTSHHRRMGYGAFFIPAIPFLTFSLFPHLFITQHLWLSVVCAVILFIIGFWLRSGWGILSIIGAMTILGYVIGLSDHRHVPFQESVITYIPNRYENQTMYEGATQLARVINQRFDRLSVETFRLWYANDPKMLTFNAVVSIYVRGTERVLGESIIPSNTALVWREQTRYIPNNVVILLSSQHTPAQLFDMAQDALNRHRYAPIWQDSQWIDDGAGGFYAVFITITRQ